MHHRNFIAALLFAAWLCAPFAALAADTHAKGAEPLHISMGQTVQLADYLVPGKTTVFDFYSKYCPPCMRIAPGVKKLHETRDDIAVVEVDINRPDIEGIDWQSPVAREFQLDSIPHFKIYGPDGKLKSEGDDAYETIQNWVK